MNGTGWQLETTLIHGGFGPDEKTGATVPAIAPSTAFAYRTAEELEAVFAGREPGFVYSRMGNPTVAAFEARIRDLEGGVGAVAVSSGMAAVSSLALALTGSGEDIVAGRSLFGGTYSLFQNTLARFGVGVRFVDASRPVAFREAIRDTTRLVFVEAIGNPRLDVPDIAAIAEVTRSCGVPLAVDGTVATPLLLQARKWGADVVVHSTSKFINGHGNAIGGVIVDSGSFDWSSPRFPHLAPFRARAGQLALLAMLRQRICRDMGCCLAPFNAFLLNMGIETLGVRMERHCANAEAVAAFLSTHPKVGSVRYPGLAVHAEHSLARRQFGGRFGAILTFRLGTRARCFQFINGLSLARNLANLGDTRTLVIHPGSTICREFDAAEREAMGVTDDLVRLSVGIEDPADIVGDIEQALGAL